MSDPPRRNRPPIITPRPQEKSSLHVLLPPDKKARVIAEAEASARSLSTEGGFRIETTLTAQDLLGQALRMFWPTTHELVILAGMLANKFVGQGQWRSPDPGERSIFLMSISRALTCLFDPEDALRRFDPENPDKLAGIEDRTDYFLHALGDPDIEASTVQRERLGSIAPHLINWHNLIETHPAIQARRRGELPAPVVNVDADAMWDAAIEKARAAREEQQKHQAETRQRRRGRLADETADEARQRRDRKGEQQ